MNVKLEFLNSTRFWAGVVGSLSVVLISPDFFINPWYVNLGKFLGLLATVFIGIRSLDRTAEYLGDKK